MRALIALLALVAGGALAAPPDRVVRIGVVMSYFPTATPSAIAAVAEGLRELGYVDGKNMILETRTARFPDGPMQSNVDEILSMRPDVVIAGCGWSTSVLMRATQTVPIVMVAASDPVGRGWVTSLPRPGANITGVSGMLADLPAKMVDHLRIVLPEIRSVGIGLNMRVQTSQGIFRELDATAKAIGVRIVPIDLNGLADVAAMRAALAASGAQAIMNVPDDNLFWTSVERIVAAANELKIPVVTFRSDFLAEGGALLSYGANPRTLFKRTALYADRIVNGARPAVLPVELPFQLEFSINLKQAAALGITIPKAALLRADHLVR
jgi:putative ABC transport system substrate-binding protein